MTQPFLFPVRVYFSDTDAGGIVYHGKYLYFAEHARTEMFRAICAELPVQDGQEPLSQNILLTQGIAFVVKSISISYEMPAHVDELLCVQTSVTSLKRFSMTFSQRVLRDGDLLASLEVRIASLSTQTGRPLPIPQYIAQSLM